MIAKHLLPLLTVLPLAGCYLFTDEGRPCDPAGVCLPGFVCVKGLCQKKGVLQINEPCRATGECVSGAVCADIYCDDSAGTKCKAASECPNGGEDEFNCYGGQCECKRVCRPNCDYPDFGKCKSGQLCWPEVEQDVGFCQEGNCGERDDGTSVGNCTDTEVCLEFNGPGSGVCNALCHILKQNASDCTPGPPPQGVLCCAANQNCEHIVQLWGTSVDPNGELGICFDSGTQIEGGTCSADPAVNLYCLRGMVCNVGNCVKYCDVGGGAPACAANQQCIDFTSQVILQYGYCH